MVIVMTSTQQASLRSGSLKVSDGSCVHDDIDEPRLDRDEHWKIWISREWSFYRCHRNFEFFFQPGAEKVVGPEKKLKS